MLRRYGLALAILVMLSALPPGSAWAGSFTYYGPHLGFAQGPDQFVVGGHMQWNGVAPRVAFVPGIDLGLGNDQTLVELNGDFHYQLATGTHWQPYLGGGVGLDFPSGGSGRNDASAGGHLIVGAAVPNAGSGRFFTELKLGFGDSTDLKVMAGWNLRAR
jgi:hypothetical protein